MTDFYSFDAVAQVQPHHFKRACCQLGLSQFRAWKLDFYSMDIPLLLCGAFSHAADILHSPNHAFPPHSSPFCSPEPPVFDPSPQSSPQPIDTGKRLISKAAIPGEGQFSFTVKAGQYASISNSWIFNCLFSVSHVIHLRVAVIPDMFHIHLSLHTALTEPDTELTLHWLKRSKKDSWQAQWIYCYLEASTVLFMVQNSLSTLQPLIKSSTNLFEAWLS